MTDSVLQRLAASLVSRPWVYDVVQRLAGRSDVIDRLQRMVAGLPAVRVFDVGSAGGGLSASLGYSPVCLDIDPRSIQKIRRRNPGALGLVGDAAILPFRDRSFDLSLCVDISHHLAETSWQRMLAELARVTDGTLVFLDAVRDDRRLASRILWRYDRGRFPRTRSDILDALGREFSVREVVDFSVYHRYFLCTATSD